MSILWLHSMTFELVSHFCYLVLIMPLNDVGEMFKELDVTNLKDPNLLWTWSRLHNIFNLYAFTLVWNNFLYIFIFIIIKKLCWMATFALKVNRIKSLCCHSPQRTNLCPWKGIHWLSWRFVLGPMQVTIVSKVCIKGWEEYLLNFQDTRKYSKFSHSGLIFKIIPRG